MASALNVYSEVNIEEEMNQPYVEQFKLQMKEKLVEAIHFLSRRTGGQLHSFLATIECVNFADYKNCTHAIYMLMH